ncbi:MAG: nickel pincer cofactor biosynthesis protein LarB [Thermodesulfovibrionales bacterium]
MKYDALREIIDALGSGRLGVDEAMERLSHMTYEDISIAKIDHFRDKRQGIPEVIFASGKSDAQVVGIARSMYRRRRALLITRATRKIYSLLRIKGAVFHEASGMIAVGGEKVKKGSVLVVTAGTSDIPVAEEAAVTASFLGSRVTSLFDVGVAGLHRLFHNLGEINSARVVIVVAGMEGALPSVVGGMTDKPIIAVPTSSGYGTSLGGLTALFAMLNSCVPGIAVVNIDNGFGAGCLAHKMNCLP